MLTGIIQIGEYISKRDNREVHPHEKVIENPNGNGKYESVLKVQFERNEQAVTFKCIDYEKFSKVRMFKYAYKKGSARGGDYTPTSKYTEAYKTLNKIKTSIGNILSVSGKSVNGYGYFHKISGQMDTHLEKIKTELEAKANKKSEGYIVTVTLLENGKEKYVGEFEIVKQYLGRMANEQYYIKYGKTSKGTGTCFYCLRNTEVFGFVNTFNFYTLDKAGFVAGGFNQEDAWKNYPVCSKCAQLLEDGKRYIMEKLTSRFSSFTYSVIPRITFGDCYDLEDMFEALEYEENKKFSLKSGDSLLKSEKDFLSIMKESGNNINYNIMIFNEDKASFKILLYIEDIIPSKLKNIFRIKDKVDSIDLFKNLPGKDNTLYDLRFGFDKIRFFFPNNKVEGNFDKSFLEMLDSIFSYKTISYKFILNRMASKIRAIFSREEYYDTAVLKAAMIIAFITKMGLFKDKKEGREGIMPEKTEKSIKYIEFLEAEQHKPMFDADYKKAVFLTGVLTKKLLNIQYASGGSQPFYSRLNGLKLDSKHIRRIFAEAFNKLTEYNENYYYTLEELIGEYMLGENSDTMSNDEISFYFVLGMVMAGKFKESKEDKEGV